MTKNKTLELLLQKQGDHPGHICRPECKYLTCPWEIPSPGNAFLRYNSHPYIYHHENPKVRAEKDGTGSLKRILHFRENVEITRIIHFTDMRRAVESSICGR